MSDQGLSIFDQEPDLDDGPTEGPGRSGSSPDGESTQRIPAVGATRLDPEEASTAPQSAVPVTTAPGTPAARPPAPAAPAGPAGPAAASGGRTVPPARPTFPVVRRGGYDKTAVDLQVGRLVTEHASASSGLTQAEQRVGELEAELAAARQELSEQRTPSYAGLGGRASALLRLAEEEADEIREQALRDAHDIREQAARNGEAIRAEAAREAEDMRSVQLSELDETRSRMTADLEQERALARSEAGDLVAAARREADQQRLAAQQEAGEVRTAAVREAEQARAAADREVQEARRSLAVEKERLAREATDHHNSATAETRRLVEEAEQRAGSAEERAAQVTQQTAEHRASSQKEAEALLNRARREAEQVVAAARSQADTVRAAGDADLERQVETLKMEVSRLSRRRDAITAQLSSLRDVIAGFADDEVDTGDAAPGASAPTSGPEPASGSKKSS